MKKREFGVASTAKITAVFLGAALSFGMITCNGKAAAIAADSSASEVTTQTTGDTTESSTSTTSTITEGIDYPGSSMTEAYLLPLGTKYYGTVKEESAWFAFTTGSEEEAAYTVTVVNRTVYPESAYGSGTGIYLQTSVMDQYGNELDGKASAKCEGAPVSFEMSDLEPNTTYYAYICSNDNQYNEDGYNYSICIKNKDTAESGIQTIENIDDATGPVVEDNEIISGNTNVDDAVLLSYNTKVTGTLNEQECTEIHDWSWFSFKTGSTEGATYRVTYTNLTGDTDDSVWGEVYDEYGNMMHSNSQGWAAKNDGIPKTRELTDLEPDTTYYIALYESTYGNASKVEYSLTVTCDESVEKSSQTFESPFEINETQIQFVAESEEFINENQAITALEPVAEAILAHPDNKILIAGTTATDGEQTARVKLSEARAEAVKKVLINTYNVPESQIQTIGLGYEDDPFERGQDRVVAGDITSDFVESEGRKNRRVVVMDLDSEAAQQILSK